MRHSLPSIRVYGYVVTGSSRIIGYARRGYIREKFYTCSIYYMMYTYIHTPLYEDKYREEDAYVQVAKSEEDNIRATIQSTFLNLRDSPRVYIEVKSAYTPLYAFIHTPQTISIILRFFFSFVACAGIEYTSFRKFLVQTRQTDERYRRKEKKKKKISVDCKPFQWLTARCSSCIYTRLGIRNRTAHTHLSLAVHITLFVYTRCIIRACDEELHYLPSRIYRL